MTVCGGKNTELGGIAGVVLLDRDFATFTLKICRDH